MTHEIPEALEKLTTLLSSLKHPWRGVEFSRRLLKFLLEILGVLEMTLTSFEFYSKFI